MIAFLSVLIEQISGQFEFFAATLAVAIAVIGYVAVSRWPVNSAGEKDRPQWIILYACALQSIWGFSLFFFPESTIAAWSGFVYWPRWLLSSTFLASALLSYYALVHRKGIMWLLPQQGMMMIAAIGSLCMVVLGHYADGAPYPRIFILRDQLPEILTAIFHTAAIYNRERVRLIRQIQAPLIQWNPSKPSY